MSVLPLCQSTEAQSSVAKKINRKDLVWLMFEVSARGNDSVGLSAGCVVHCGCEPVMELICSLTCVRKQRGGEKELTFTTNPLPSHTSVFICHW